MMHINCHTKNCVSEGSGSERPRSGGACRPASQGPFPSNDCQAGGWSQILKNPKESAILETQNHLGPQLVKGKFI